MMPPSPPATPTLRCADAEWRNFESRIICNDGTTIIHKVAPDCTPYSVVQYDEISGPLPSDITCRPFQGAAPIFPYIAGAKVNETGSSGLPIPQPVQDGFGFTSSTISVAGTIGLPFVLAAAVQANSSKSWARAFKHDVAESEEDLKQLGVLANQYRDHHEVLDSVNELARKLTVVDNHVDKFRMEAASRGDIGNFVSGFRPDSWWKAQQVRQKIDGFGDDLLATTRTLKRLKAEAVPVPGECASAPRADGSLVPGSATSSATPVAHAQMTDISSQDGDGYAADEIVSMHSLAISDREIGPSCYATPTASLGHDNEVGSSGYATPTASLGCDYENLD